ALKLSAQWGSDRAVARHDHPICGENGGVGLGRTRSASVASDHVRFWHLADIDADASMSAFSGKADIPACTTRQVSLQFSQRGFLLRRSYDSMPRLGVAPHWRSGRNCNDDTASASRLPAGTRWDPLGGPWPGGSTKGTGKELTHLP